MQRNLNQSPATGTETAAQAASFRQNAEGFAKIKDIIFLMLGHWKWFVLSLAVAFGAAYYYLQITPKVYTASAAILVKSDEKNSGSEDMLLDLGIKAQKVNITNEIMSMLTGSVADEITHRLQLNTEYYHPGTFHKTVAYGVELPVTVELPDLGQAESASFNLQLRKDSTIRISSIVLNDKALDGSLTFSMGKAVKTPLGTMTVKPSPYYREGFQDELTISRIPFSTASAQIRSSIDARQRNNRASIIDITYSDQSRTRAEDILSTLVAVYNENWIKDRNQVTASTTEFIKERLSIIESELGNVDSDISDYKSRNLVTDVSAMGGIALSQMNSSQEAGRELDNRVYMTKYLRNYLTDGMHEKEQLPANSGIDNPSIEAQIQAYNQLLLQRLSLIHISEPTRQYS